MRLLYIPATIDLEKKKRKPNARRKLRDESTQRNIKRTRPRRPPSLSTRYLGPHARCRNTQAVQKGDLLDHVLILTLAPRRATPTDRIDQDQKGGVTYQALLEIHNLIRGPGADLIPEVSQGLISGFGHP